MSTHNIMIPFISVATVEDHDHQRCLNLVKGAIEEIGGSIHNPNDWILDLERESDKHIELEISLSSFSTDPISLSLELITEDNLENVSDMISDPSIVFYLNEATFNNLDRDELLDNLKDTFNCMATHEDLWIQTL